MNDKQTNVATQEGANDIPAWVIGVLAPTVQEALGCAVRRLRIMERLAQGPAGSGTLTAHLGGGTVEHHVVADLRVLKQAGLVAVVAHGRSTAHALTDEGELALIGVDPRQALANLTDRILWREGA